MQEKEVTNQVAEMRQFALNIIGSIREEIERHTLSKNVLTDIENDQDIQKRYSDLMKRINEGNGSTDTLDELMAYSPHDQAGYMLFTIKNYEETQKVKLLTEDERAL